MKRCSLILFILFMLGCHEKEMVSFRTGGLSYPQKVSPLDSSFYIYQYKDSLSTLDSLAAAEYGQYFLIGFKEPNLSITPQQKTVFRFTYNESLSPPIIINLMEDRLIVKEGINGGPYPYFDVERLSKSEQEQLNLSEWYFRTGVKKMSDERWRPYFDSIMKAYPEFRDIKAYKALREKSGMYNREKFEYSVKTILIKKERYRQLVKLIDESGFWSLPRESWCKNVPNDGAYFTLEANTALQYKIVGSPNCPDDNRRFTMACQEIANSAGLNKKIQLIWEGGIKLIDTSEIKEVPLAQPEK